MTLKTRLAQLEKRQRPAPQPAQSCDAVRAAIVAKLEAVERGEALQAAQDTSPKAEALRAEILARIERIAEAQ